MTVHTYSIDKVKYAQLLRMGHIIGGQVICPSLDITFGLKRVNNERRIWFTEIGYLAPKDMGRYHGKS